MDLENISFFQNPGDSATTALTAPGILTKTVFVEFFDRARDSILQLFEIRFGPVAPSRRFDHTRRIIYTTEP